MFTDVTKEAGLAGTGYDMGVAVGDYDNDGYPDLFVAGVHGNTLYHNNGNGTFTDVTAKAGLDKSRGSEIWAVVGNGGGVGGREQRWTAGLVRCELSAMGLEDRASVRSFEGSMTIAIRSFTKGSRTNYF